MRQSWHQTPQSAGLFGGWLFVSVLLCDDSWLALDVNPLLALAQSLGFTPTCFNLSCGQGRNREAQFPGRRKVPTMSHLLSSIQYICFRKTSVSNMGAPTCFLPRAPSNLVTPLVALAVCRNTAKWNLLPKLRMWAIVVRTWHVSGLPKKTSRHLQKRPSCHRKLFSDRGVAARTRSAACLSTGWNPLRVCHWQDVVRVFSL